MLAASFSMDRLENQDVAPFAAPGLLPGLLGIGMLLLGGVLLARSLRRGAMGGPATTGEALPRSRAALVIVLCVLFNAVLVGHGLPFWLAATLFVTVAVPVLRQGSAGGRQPIDGRSILAAGLIGLCSGLVITVVFQQIFLVRLP